MNYFKYCLFILLIITVGCDVLNQDPQTAISEDIAIRDQKSAEAALNGLYSQLQSGDYYGSNLQIISEVTSDISQSVGTWDFYREMDTYVTSAGNLENRNLWSQAYTTVNHANNLIADVPNLEGPSQEVKDKILGEAYFIRALAYFDLTRTYGGIPGVAGSMGVPLVTEPSREINEDSYPSRASIEASYAQVESDLQEAEARLSGFTTANYASEAAAKALLSRLYLYLQDFDQAEQYATEVIDNYSFTLVDDFADIFVSENSPEAIFELAFNTTDGNDIRFWHFPSSGGGRGDIALHDDYAEMVMSRSADERAGLIGFDENVGVYYPTKYQKPGEDDNIQVLRLAEMYLNRAEARARKSAPDLTGALSDLNRIRSRAGLSDTTGTGVDTPDEVLMAIEHERAIEFMEEGHRWFNMVRTGRAMAVFTDIDRTNGDPVSLTNAGRMVFPIPSRDIDANENLDQNEAYK
ncbi:RagB/SusD family nutrient uptake outer membrane protein [Fodinibius salsisoli]|uniref:RagB/SusD family nutrient uptake outer membrane protein n=1 Tax=Fodinibius salsisoli TaxID=2820877 RepID=A0ABT3PIT4_9BACT|nr:RagB/SusD family nutrient uptake outer membrane protein [Fodinibius salsisoli]MCW9705688.1 RagB/SusD family nutrient uptake outer membrane protein [Fodinibius salsisoli]